MDIWRWAASTDACAPTHPTLCCSPLTPPRPFSPHFQLRGDPVHLAGRLPAFLPQGHAQALRNYWHRRLRLSLSGVVPSPITRPPGKSSHGPDNVLLALFLPASVTAASAPRDGVSESAKDLVSSMLMVNHHLRPTAEVCAQSPASARPIPFACGQLSPASCSFCACRVAAAMPRPPVVLGGRLRPGPGRGPAPAPQLERQAQVSGIASHCAEESTYSACALCCGGRWAVVASTTLSAAFPAIEPPRANPLSRRPLLAWFAGHRASGHCDQPNGLHVESQPELLLGLTRRQRPWLRCCG